MKLNTLHNNLHYDSSALYFVAFFLCLTYWGCANRVALTGGAKDETPPKIEYSLPNNGSINYHSKEIILRFDEYIKLNNFQSEFISSPPLQNLPNYRIRGKSIVLKLEDDLKDSTTYILDFGNSIQDITEGNTLKNYQFAFSTGPFIDSLKVSGKILNAFDLKPEKSIAIMLYENLSDSAPRKVLPNYYTKSVDNGSFSLNHVKEGVYQLFALIDANSNYRFDLPTEKIAFIDTLIHAGKTDSLTLYLFEEANSKLHINKIVSDEYGKLLFVFNQPADSAKIIPLHTNLPANWKIEEWSVNHDSLIYWIPDSILDTLKLQIITDTLVDTNSIALAQKNPLSSTFKKNKRVKEFKLTNTSNVTSAFDLNKDILIHFSHPLTEYDFSQFILVQEKDTLKPQLSFKDKLHKQLLIKHKWREETNYSLFIPDSTIKDIFNLYNDSIRLSFKTKSLKQYGTATLSIQSTDTIHTFIVQLQNEKGTVLREDYFTKADTFEYTYLDPGNYKLKAIQDINGNKKWDTGSYDKKQLPEKVAFYSQPLTIRANWDIDVEWSLK